MRFLALLRLVCCRDIYDHKKTQALFDRLLLKNHAFMQARCKPYRLLCEKEKRGHPVNAEGLPALPTLFLKKHPMYAKAPTKRMLHVTSSGTKGEKTHLYFDPMSVVLGVFFLLRTFWRHKLFSFLPVDYIVLGYEPSKENRMGAAKSAYGATWATPARSRTYALEKNGAGYRVNIKGIEAKLIDCAAKNRPVRFVGFTPYLSFLIEEIEKRDVCLSLHPRSMILLGGGWKAFDKQMIDREAMLGRIQKRLGIQKSACKEFFSAVEHPVGYCTCAHQHFHVPAISRVIIRDVHTLKPLPYGQVGLLSFVTPMVWSMPLLSVMTDDLAVLYPGQTCGCGNESPYFELCGRAGLEKVMTCAISASQWMDKKEAGGDG